MKKNMKTALKFIPALLFALALFMIVPASVKAEDETIEAAVEETVSETQKDVRGPKAMAAAIAIGAVATAGAVGMAVAIAKSVESIARQPEAEGKIRTTLMLGLVFIETAIIYALIVAILIIFVL